MWKHTHDSYSAYIANCTSTHARTHAHTHLTALCPRLPGSAGTRKVKPIWILLKQETVSGSGISWAIRKSAPRSREITTPAPHHSVFYRPDAIPPTRTTASKHCASNKWIISEFIYLWYILLIVDDQQRDTEQYRAESIDGFLEFTLRRQLVRHLQTLNQVTQLQSYSWHTAFSTGLFPANSHTHTWNQQSGCDTLSTPHCNDNCQQSSHRPQTRANMMS